jgi:outer membrane immunogenic protein
MRGSSFVAPAVRFVVPVARARAFVSAAWRARRRWCLGPPTRIGDRPVGAGESVSAPPRGICSGSNVVRKIILSALAGTAALGATPAFAQDNAAQNFRGFHVEAIAGYDNVNIDGTHRDGIAYGIGAGYDFRSNNVVYGVEAEIADSSVHEDAGNDSFDAARDLYIGGRLGVVVSPNVMVYAKAGYTNARVEFTSGGITDGTNLDGIRGGAGVEWHLRNSPISLRAEYRYSNYEFGVSRNQGVVGMMVRF